MAYNEQTSYNTLQRPDNMQQPDDIKQPGGMQRPDKANHQVWKVPNASVIRLHYNQFELRDAVSASLEPPFPSQAVYSSLPAPFADEAPMPIHVHAYDSTLSHFC